MDGSVPTSAVTPSAVDVNWPAPTCNSFKAQVKKCTIWCHNTVPPSRAYPMRHLCVSHTTPQTLPQPAQTTNSPTDQPIGPTDRTNQPTTRRPASCWPSSTPPPPTPRLPPCQQKSSTRTTCHSQPSRSTSSDWRCSREAELATCRQRLGAACGRVAVVLSSEV